MGCAGARTKQPAAGNAGRCVTRVPPRPPARCAGATTLCASTFRPSSAANAPACAVGERAELRRQTVAPAPPMLRAVTLWCSIYLIAACGTAARTAHSIRSSWRPFQNARKSGCGPREAEAARTEPELGRSRMQCPVWAGVRCVSVPIAAWGVWSDAGLRSCVFAQHDDSSDGDRDPSRCALPVRFSQSRGCAGCARADARRRTVAQATVRPTAKRLSHVCTHLPNPLLAASTILSRSKTAMEGVFSKLANEVWVLMCVCVCVCVCVRACVCVRVGMQ